MGKRKDKEEKSHKKSKKKKYDYYEEEKPSVIPLETMFDSLIGLYPKDTSDLRNLLEDLDGGCFVDVSDIEDRTVKTLLIDMFIEHFKLLRDKETREYYKDPNDSRIYTELFDKYLQEYRSRETQKQTEKPKSLYELHAIEKSKSQSELEKKELQKKGYMIWNRDDDLENPTTAVDKNRLKDMVNNASKFSQKFNSRMETKFL